MTVTSPALALWIYDSRQSKIWANEAFAELYSLDGRVAGCGIPRADFIARVHPSDVDRVVGRFDRAIANAGSFSESYQVRSENQEGRFVLDQGDHLLQGEHWLFCGTSVALDHSQFTDLARGNSCLDAMAAHCINARKIADQLDLKVARHLLDMTMIEVGQKLAAVAKRKLLDWH